MRKKKEVKKEVSIFDWIDRDDDYVHRGGIRSGWDKDYNSTTGYVLEGFLKPVTPEGEIREINNLCTNRSVILSDGKPVVFTINAHEKTAKTDGKKVTVGTSVLDETEKTFEQKADIMVGLTTHEMAHIKYSVFSHLRKVKSKMHKAILNVIEDERIEHLLCEEYPGYASNISMLKKYFLDEKYIVEDALESTLTDKSEIRAAELFDILFKMVRYPKFLSIELVKKYSSEFEQMKGLLNPYPMTANKAFDASEKIYEIIRGKVKESLEEEKETKGELSPESKEEGEDSTSSEKKSESESESSEDSKESLSEESEQIESKLSDIEAKIGSMMAEFESDNDPSKDVEVSPSVKEIDFDDEFVYDSDNEAKFEKGVNRKDEYIVYANDVKSDSNRLANSLFTHIFDESSVIKGLRSGTFDDCKIVDAIQGVNNVHYQKSDKQVKSVNIVLLIDESGSMLGGSRYRDAAKAAILIEKAFEKFPAGKLFIYGFTGDVAHTKNLIIRYREPGLNIKYGLGDVRPRANNRDGHCIRAVANRVRQFTNDPMLFFVISDGAPSASGYGGYEDTRQAVLEVTKKRFFPIQIGIGSGINPKDQAKMFDEFIHYTEPKKMVEDLRKLIMRKAKKVFGL